MVPNNDTRWKAQLGIAQSEKRLGQVRIRMDRDRGLDGKRDVCGSKMDMRDFVTFALRNVKYSVIHREKIGASVKTIQEMKEPRQLGPRGNTVASRREGTTVHSWEDSNVAETWINGHYAMGRSTGRKSAEYKTLHSWWKRSIAYPARNIKDYVKHIHREHSQEADHMANLRAEGVPQVNVEIVKKRNMESDTRVLGRRQKHEMEAAGAVSLPKPSTETAGSQAVNLQYH